MRDIQYRTMALIAHMILWMLFMSSINSDCIIDESLLNQFSSIDIDSSIRFLQIGDWGGKNRKPYWTVPQQQTAIGMERIASLIEAEFILGSGDNFYNFGVKNVSDTRFDITWRDIYFHSPYLRHMPWYQIAGNHDHDGNISAQLQYSFIDPKWVFPSLYYKKSFISRDWTVSLDIIFIDTTRLTNVKTGSKYPKNIQDNEQYQWLRQTLASSTADYILVNGHYPVYSPCMYGNVQTLVNHLKPLLEQYNAHYISGHEHCLSHVIVNGVNYWLNGIGMTCCYSNYEVNNLPSGSLYYILAMNLPYKVMNGIDNTNSGFSSMIFARDKMMVTYHNQDGQILYSSTVSPRSISIKDR